MLKTHAIIARMGFVFKDSLVYWVLCSKIPGLLGFVFKDSWFMGFCVQKILVHGQDVSTDLFDLSLARELYFGATSYKLNLSASKIPTNHCENQSSLFEDWVHVQHSQNAITEVSIL